MVVKMIETILSPISFEIWKMLDTPEDWMYDGSLNSRLRPYTIFHPETRISLWISNGGWFLDGHEESVFEYNERGLACRTLFRTRKVHIGLIDRHILWHKVKKVMQYLNVNNPSLILKELKEFNGKNGH